MATPKVFISSTCFDLGEVREQLKKFVESFGFDAILSEHGDVFYHPDLHTHEACLQEVSHCQLFILIIGGRFGGEYVSDKSKSITNAEYNAAQESKIPVFTYVKNNVLTNQLFYKENRNEPFVADMKYPSIEKQEYAIDIFKFIDDVRRSNVNNAVEGFDNFQDIESHLRKQWAGMFFDFLKTREVKSQIDATNHLLSGLSHSSNKLEELVKSLYKSVDEKGAETNIKLLELKTKLEEWYIDIFSFDDEIHSKHDIDMSKIDIDKIANTSPDGLIWYDYLVNTGLYKYLNENEIEPIFYAGESPFYYINIKNRVGSQKYITILFQEGILNSTEQLRKEVLTKVLQKYLNQETDKTKKDS